MRLIAQKSGVMVFTMTVDTKFDLGNEAWMMHENKPFGMTVGAVKIHKGATAENDPTPKITVSYVVTWKDAEGIPRHTELTEDKLSGSKEELLASL